MPLGSLKMSQTSTKWFRHAARRAVPCQLAGTTPTFHAQVERNKHRGRQAQWNRRREREAYDAVRFGKGAPPDNALGFEHTRITTREAVGRRAVTETCCQPFKMLNGGVSALIAESAASIGGYMSSGYRRVAGVQLSINHVGPARLGDGIEAQARPIQVGSSIQVWEVQIWRIHPTTSQCKDVVSTARVTL